MKEILRVSLFLGLIIFSFKVFAEAVTTEDCKSIERDLKVLGETKILSVDDITEALSLGASLQCYGDVICEDPSNHRGKSICAELIKFEEMYPDKNQSCKERKKAITEQRKMSKFIFSGIRNEASRKIQEFPELQVLNEKLDLWSAYEKMILEGRDNDQRKVLGETENSWPQGDNFMLMIKGERRFDLYETISDNCSKSPVHCLDQFELGKAYFKIVRMQKRALNQISRPDREGLLSNLSGNSNCTDDRR